jgi:hypothetical protein
MVEAGFDESGSSEDGHKRRLLGDPVGGDVQLVYEVHPVGGEQSAKPVTQRHL